MLINADDFGIGPATSEGILQLAERGVVTSSVLLANSPHAEQGISQWRAHGARLELGWHPTLTLDRPVLPPEQIPSLVDAEGKFWGLGAFLKRKLCGRIAERDVRAEFTAQYRRCCELLGHPPDIVNTHHHVQIFRPIGTILKQIILEQKPVPYMRLVREPWPMLWRIGGTRIKRRFINWLGRRAGRRQRRAGLLGRLDHRHQQCHQVARSGFLGAVGVAGARECRGVDVPSRPAGSDPDRPGLPGG